MKYSPMLCKLIERPFKDTGWIFEQKIDGVRIIAVKNGQQVRLLTRNNKDKSQQFPEIAQAIQKLKPRQVVLDGEIAAFRKGVSSFQAIQPRVGQTDTAEIKKLIKTSPVQYLVFDLLNLENRDWEAKPLIERKKKLQVIIQGFTSSPPTPPLGKGRIGRGLWQKTIVYLNHISSDGAALFKKAKQKHWEGIIGKKKDSKYLEGKRGNNWVKIKTHNQQELVIGAYTLGQGKTKDTFGAILVGYYKSGKLIYAGKVGTGFTEDERKDLKKRFSPIRTTKSPFSTPITEREITWLKPRLVGEFAFGEWTKDNILRQPVYMGLRIDKPAKSVIKEN